MSSKNGCKVVNLPAIRSFLDRTDAVIFVGSGVSCWAGLPGWRSLMEELAEFLEAKGESSALVRSEVAGGDLLQAASYGFSKLTPPEIGEFVRKAVRLGTAKPGAIHKAIVDLGPTCYITTNFDNLIEQALAQWQPDTFYPMPVTNGHLAEIADILSARSSHFIFKPHGDASDAASIVLTREQYRMLLPDGERHRALEAVKTLLVTRPVLYLGFGLRDPDFLYLRDLLINTFQGATRDHFAIMPDVRDDEADYWRHQYGIRLVGYRTHARPDGTRDHHELLDMLASLASSAQQNARSLTASPVEEIRSNDAERVLALTRYTAGLMRLAPQNDPIEVRVSSLQENPRSYAHIDTFENWTATRFLTKGPSHALLIGLPGAGKTFALRLATAHIAQAVQQACLDDTIEKSNLVLPVLIDLKLYQGDLRAQIDAALPAGFSLKGLLGELRLKLFLDAFNEMPSIYLEEGSLPNSLEELRQELGEFDYVITSRTTDGLPTQGLSHYELARFDIDHVNRALADSGFTLSGPFEMDIRWLLTRPFFLHLVTSGKVQVPEGARPKDIYASFVNDLDRGFAERFFVNRPLITALSRVAYRALDDEREAFPLSWLTDELLMIAGTSVTSTQDMVNWLIARGAVIPYSGGRISFVHQSITEYCAAVELVRLSEAGIFSQRETVALKKWDQCLFMALGMMAESKANEILDFLTRTDLALAFSAVRYADENQSASISKLLAILVERGHDKTDSMPWHFGLPRLPLGAEHAGYLEEILTFGGTLAGEAVEALTIIRGEDYKPTLLELLDREKDDYNFSVNGIARALKPLLVESDLPHLLTIAIGAASTGNENSGSAVRDVLSWFEPDKLIAAARDHMDSPPSPGLLRILCGALGNREDKRSFEILADFVLELQDEAITAFYFCLPHDDDALKDMVGVLTLNHVHALWQGRFSAEFWDEALRRVCHLRPDLAEEMASIARGTEGIERIALLSCLSGDLAIIHEELERLASQSNSELALQPFNITDLADLDWTGTGSLYPRLLVRDVPLLRSSLLGGSSPCEIRGLGSLGPEALIPISEMAAALQGEEHYWHKRQLGGIVARYGDQDVRSYLLDQLSHGKLPVRRWVKTYVLPFLDNVSTDDMSEDAIGFLLADLSRTDALSIWNNPLGHVASERFVTERLIPLCRGASETVLSNIRIVLKAAGDRHGRRYLLPN